MKPHFNRRVLDYIYGQQLYGKPLDVKEMFDTRSQAEWEGLRALVAHLSMCTTCFTVKDAAFQENGSIEGLSGIRVVRTGLCGNALKIVGGSFTVPMCRAVDAVRFTTGEIATKALRHSDKRPVARTITVYEDMPKHKKSRVMKLSFCADCAIHAASELAVEGETFSIKDFETRDVDMNARISDRG